MSEEVRQRIGALAVGDGLSAAEVSRRLAEGSDGWPPVQVSAEVCRRTAIRIRRSGQAADTRPSALAGRMLALVEAELASLEQRGSKPLDTERLDKLAATLRRLEPLASPSESRSEPADLRSLLPAEPSGEAEGNGRI